MTSRWFDVCMHYSSGDILLFLVCDWNRGTFSTSTWQFPPENGKQSICSGRSKAAVMLTHMRRQLEIIPHFTHRYQHFRERTSAIMRHRMVQLSTARLVFFCSIFLCFPPQRTRVWLVSLCSRSGSRSHHPSLTPLFPPIRFSFPLNSLTLTHTHTSCTHTSLSYLWPWQPDCCLVVR